MDCVICLYARDAAPNVAVTVVHGHAVCAGHVSLIRMAKGDLDRAIDTAIQLEEARKR